VAHESNNAKPRGKPRREIWERESGNMKGNRKADTRPKENESIRSFMQKEGKNTVKPESTLPKFPKNQTEKEMKKNEQETVKDQMRGEETIDHRKK